MADVLRGPTFFGPYRKPLVIAVGLANLLTGTLAPAAASPFVNPQTTQVQKRQIYADTCTSSKPLLFKSSDAPVKNETLRLIQRRAILSETSQDAAPLAYPSAQRPTSNLPHPLTQRRAILSETSKSSAPLAFPSSDRPFQRQPESVNYRPPTPLQWIPPDLLTGQLGAIAAPFALPPFVQVHARPALLADTSQDSYPLVFPSLDRPFFRLPDPQVYRRAVYSDTSQSSWTASYTTQPAPFFGTTPPLVDRRLILSDTSLEGFPPLYPSSDPPFTREPEILAQDTQWKPLDTSISSPGVLLSVPVESPFSQGDWPAPIEYRKNWLYQQTFYGQNPDGIPPAVIVPPVVTPDTTGAGKSKKTRKRRLELEIDGEIFAVESETEALAILDSVRAEAQQKAEEVTERARLATTKPKRKILQDARKSLPLPVIAVPAVLQESANAALAAIESIYNDAMRAVEIGALLRKQADEQDEEDILLLML